MYKDSYLEAPLLELCAVDFVTDNETGVCDFIMDSCNNVANDARTLYQSVSVGIKISEFIDAHFSPIPHTRRCGCWWFAIGTEQ